MNLRVKIDDIKEAGLDLRHELAKADLASIIETPPTGFKAGGPAELTVHLDRIAGRDIVARGDVEVPAVADCRRCLTEVKVPVPVHFELDFVEASKVRDLAADTEDEDAGEGEVAGSFRAEQADQVVYTGKELDLEPVVREQVLLALPMDALCNDDCKGLCQVCGGNLNEKECACDRHVPDPRWAGLKDIKLS